MNVFKVLILVHFISSLIDILFVSIFLNMYYWQHDVYILALLWPQQIPASNSKIFKQRRDDEEALQRLNFDQIELEFRNRVSNLPVISVNLYIVLLTLIQEIYWCFLNSFVRQFSFKKLTLTSKGFLNIVTDLFVDEKELPEPEEDLPDLWPTPGWLHQSGGSQVYPVSVHSAHVWSAL